MRTVLLVSHNMAAIQGLCDHALLLSAGQLVMEGPANDVVDRYVRDLNAATGVQRHADVSLAKHPGRPAACQPLVRRLRILAGDGTLANGIPVGAEVAFELEYRNEEAIAGLGFAIILCTDTGQRLGVLHSRIQSQLHVPGCRHGRILCHVPELPLLPGTYRVDIEVRNWGQLIDSIEQATLFSVLENDYFGTGRLPDRKWGAVAWGCQWSHRTLESPRIDSTGDDASAAPQYSSSV